MSTRVVAAAATLGVASASFGSTLILSYDFVPTVQLDFDGLSAGLIAYPSAIAPGASFSNDAQGDLANLFLPVGGNVVDEGAGDFALNMIDPATAPTHSSILIKFDTPFTAFAATWTYVGGGDQDGNPAYEVFDAAGNLIESLGSDSDISSPRVFGLKDMATPGTYIAISYSTAGVNGENWNIDDLWVGEVPAPGTLGLVLAGGASGVLRRRR